MRKLVKINNEVAECHFVTKIDILVLGVVDLSIRIFPLNWLAPDLERATKIAN
jgi:hypothetical protein